jgi:hypothetical protein
MLRPTNRQSEKRSPWRSDGNLIRNRWNTATARLADQPSRFILLEREVELEYRPRMLEAWQTRSTRWRKRPRNPAPECPQCGQPMTYHDARPVSWVAHWGRLRVCPVHYRCSPLQTGTAALVGSSGCRAGAHLRLFISAMGAWRVAQRLGQAAASYSEALIKYHADSQKEAGSVEEAPPPVVLGIDGCTLGMQVRTHRRRRVRLDLSRLSYGEDSAQADRWVHQIAEDLRADNVPDVIVALKRFRPKTEELRAVCNRYYSENARRMRSDEYFRLGYGIGSGAVESAHKQVVHARRALDRMDLSPAEIPNTRLSRLFGLDGDYAEALWALEQPQASLDLQAMLRDTLAALDQRPEASARFRTHLPAALTPSWLN